VGTSETLKPTGPGGEYCRVCRATADEEAEHERLAFSASQDSQGPRQSDISVVIPSQHVLGRASKGSDLDVVAVPYVFRYLCAELASMGIAVSLSIQ
jgi:DNA-directed RNA polymerase I subunit RPA2